MDTSIGTVSIEIESKSQSASSGIKELTTNLLNLRNATSGSYKNLSRLSSYLDQLKTSSAGLKAVNSNFSNLSGLMTGLKSFGDLPKGKELGSLLNKIKKIPEVFKNLSDADIEKFTKKINALTIALTPLATQMEKVSAGFMAFPSKLEKVANGVSRSSKKTTSIFSFLSRGITGFYVKTSLFVAGLRQITNVIKGFVQQSSNYNEALNLFTVSMGQYVNEAQAFVDKFSSALYLDPVNVMTYMGTFQSLIQGLGVGSKNAYAMSTAMTQLTYDLSSFRNIDFETAFLKIQSGLSGELEPLRNVGIALDMATLQQLAYSLGIEKTINEMTQAEKVELRYLQIMKSTTKMQGDMGRTILQPANALRVLQQQFTLLARAIGNIFIPILMRLLPYVMVVTEMLTKLANTVASALGFKIQEVDYSSLQNGSSYFDDLANSADSAGEAIKGVLAPFDELNIVTKNTNDTNIGGVSSGGGLGLELPTYDALMGAVTRNLEDIRQQVKDILPFIETIGLALLSWKIGNGVMDFIGQISENKGMQIALGLTFVVVGISLISQVSDAIKSDKLSWKAILLALGGVGATFGGTVLAMTAAGLTTITAVTVGLAVTDIVLVGEAIKDIKDFMDASRTIVEENGGFWKTWSEGMKTIFTEVGDSVSTWFNDNVKPRFDPEVWKTFGGYMKDGLSNKWGEFTNWWKNTGVSTWFNNNVAPWFTRDKWSGIGTRAWEGLKSAFSKVGEFFNSTLGVPLKGFGNSFVGMAEGIGNAFIEAFNFIKKMLNKFKVTVPDWVPSIGGKKWGFNLSLSEPISLKRYENGGFPDKASMFMANENGIPEMIGRIGNQTAVANNDQITTAVAQAVYAATVKANQETQSQNTTIVNLGNKTLYSDMGKRISRTNDRYGTNVVTI